jgi:hypothetical protein
LKPLETTLVPSDDDRAKLGPVERALVVALVLVGCGGRAVGLVPSDEASSSAGSSSGGGSSGGKPATVDVDARGFPILMPQSTTPPVQGDGRLPDVPEARVGEPKNGWDTCYGTPHLTTGAAAGCASCPTAQRGDDYLVAGLSDAPVDPQAGSKAQLYFYFDELEPEALWFDTFWINGSSEGTTFTLWPSNQTCDPIADGATYNVEKLLMTPGKWSTACVPLDSFGAIHALALRWDTDGVLGADAFRFGPACP